MTTIMVIVMVLKKRKRKRLIQGAFTPLGVIAIFITVLYQLHN